MFIKVGKSFINPSSIRMVAVHETEVDIFFNGVLGFKTVSISEAKKLIEYLTPSITK